jgi:hypothetical protein
MKVINKTLNDKGNIESVLVDHNGDRFLLTPIEYLHLSLWGEEDVEATPDNYETGIGGEGIQVGI